MEQKWYFERQPDKSYKITNVKNGKVLDDYLAGGAGSNVGTVSSNDSSAQRWYITGTSGDYQFHPACAQDCSLDITGGSGETGANVQIWSINGTGAQRFQIWKTDKIETKDVGTDFYAAIINNNTDIDSWKHTGITDMDNVELQNVASIPEQLWYFERQEGKSYKITNVKNGKALNVSLSGDLKSNVNVADSNDNWEQRWYITGENGDYHFHPSCATDCALDITEGSGNPGANVQIYKINGSGSQRFQIWRVEKPELKPVTPVITYQNEQKNVRINWEAAENATGYDIRIYKKGGKEVISSAWKK